MPCKEIRHQNNQSACSPLFYSTYEGDCVPYLGENVRSVCQNVSSSKSGEQIAFDETSIYGNRRKETRKETVHSVVYMSEAPVVML